MELAFGNTDEGIVVFPFSLKIFSLIIQATSVPIFAS